MLFKNKKSKYGSYTKKQFKFLDKEYECIDCASFDFCFMYSQRPLDDKYDLNICSAFKGCCNSCYFFNNDRCEEEIYSDIDNPSTTSCRFWFCKHFKYTGINEDGSKK